jgi:hypothetical protein
MNFGKGEEPWDEYKAVREAVERKWKKILLRKFILWE